MYKTIWNVINQHVTKHCAGFFLTALVIGWSVAGFLAGSVICLTGGFTALTGATILFCSTGYSGLIFGFLGGIYHLYQTAKPQKKLFSHNVPFSLTKKAA